MTDVLMLDDQWLRDADFTGEAADWKQAEGEEETDAEDAVHAQVYQRQTQLRRVCLM